jgi:hypothetical protein
MQSMCLYVCRVGLGSMCLCLRLRPYLYLRLRPYLCVCRCARVPMRVLAFDNSKAVHGQVGPAPGFTLHTSPPPRPGLYRQKKKQATHAARVCVCWLAGGRGHGGAALDAVDEVLLVLAGHI